MPSDPDAISTAELDLGDQRPANDRLAMERARARLELAMFGKAEPAQIGRYQILEPLAGGGMGLVYAAYDPELDRKVALKVLHPRRSHDERAHVRLKEEARALAKLDHPNVVAVHDVIAQNDRDDQLVIVMELAAGETLAAWQSAAPRRVRELLAAYAHAGEGLAAAHSVDVIHRDFKPGNAIIGGDGRVRVLDFGLARVATEIEDTPGMFLGTPAYAAPEQLAGEPVTAASDQFSFCVALHRAIEGVPPFAGSTNDELATNIRASAVVLAKDGRAVPAWLRKVLRRGMHADPAQRYTSMRALLDEIQRPRGWRRWRWPSLAALLVGVTVLVTYLGLGSTSTELPCDGGASEIDEVWGAPERLQVIARFASIDAPYAREVEPRVLEDLDRHATDWRAMHMHACLAHRRGADSDAMLDRRMRCLRRLRGDLRAAVGVLQRTDATTVGRAQDVVAGLGSPARCGEAVESMAELDPSQTPLLGFQVEAVRDHLSHARALNRAGRDEDAIAAVRAATLEAERTGHAPLIAEAKLDHGRILLLLGKIVDATPVLREAMKTALAADRSRIAVEAAARLIYAEGMQSPDLGRLGRDLDYVESMSRALPDDHFVRPLLFNNVGGVYFAAKHRDEALHYFQLARQALGDGPTRDLELVVIDQSLAMVTPDPVLRASSARNAWHQLRSALGDHHWTVLEAQVFYAWCAPDVETAHRALAEACRDYRNLHPSLLDQYLDCENARGLLATELGKRDDARAAFAANREAARTSKDPDQLALATLATGELAVLEGHTSEAIDAFRRVIDVEGRSEHWWIRQYALQAELGWGYALQQLGDAGAARPHLETALAGFTDITHLNPSIVYRSNLARARNMLGASH
jgi:tetratricopeptide (TPR) repeat protein